MLGMESKFKEEAKGETSQLRQAEALQADVQQAVAPLRTISGGDVTVELRMRNVKLAANNIKEDA